jgi:nitroimidazol reductase NimA-like FMN-containing flavoprotein (pyridoxamine 5'-phosphate oxidase superfamily)
MTQRELETLTSEECYDLLACARVGRLVYIDTEGPIALPVNFALASGAILIRIKAGSKSAATRLPVVGFEIDAIDSDSGAGWSVLLRGPAEELAPESVPELIHAAGGAFPRPWAEGIHNGWLRITPLSISGRRLRAEALSYPI